MLNPESRELFGDALRPPDEFELDHAIATTYSLDLTAMLLAPLSFARLDGFEPPPRPGQGAADKVDPFALLKSIRGYAERLTVFCQAGQIHVPASYQRLYAYLEGSVVPVAPPSKLGVFHPKMWALRFVHPEGDVRYRLLCLSRNLTFDGSWDTVLSLDGELNRDRSRAHARNHPLADFFAALPSLVVGSVSDEIKQRVSLVADELRRVDIELPDDFHDFAFSPIGIAGKTGMPFDSVRPTARLIISPFVTDKALTGLPGSGGTLVSRIDELDQLSPDTLKRFDKVMVLADAAEQLEGTSELESSVNQWRPPPSGLHAKLFVFDEGRDATIWSGSANATTAAFTDNVEFLLPVVGKKSRVGVSQILDSISPLLVEFQGKGRTDKSLTTEERLEAALRQTKAAIARCPWVARVEPLDADRFSLGLESNQTLTMPEGVTVTVFPSSLQETVSRPLSGSVVFSPCSFEALTPFFVFRAVARIGDDELVDDFVVSATLLGAPENRLARVLDDLLSDPSKVLRFLRLLLAETPADVLSALEQSFGESSKQVASLQGSGESPLLESMLRALARQPERLEAIASLVADLESTEGGTARLPPSFLEAWRPIRAARATLERSLK